MKENQFSYETRSHKMSMCTYLDAVKMHVELVVMALIGDA